MKKIFFMMALLCLTAIGFSQNKTKLKDGLYLVASTTNGTPDDPRTDKQTAFVRFNALFSDNAPKGSNGVLVYTTDFVPLELAEDPALVDQTDTKKKLQLTFSRMASDKLASFTANNIMKQATIVVDGEALTVHKIRAAITGGKMEITRCGDNACEIIYVKLKDNVKK